MGPVTGVRVTRSVIAAAALALTLGLSAPAARAGCDPGDDHPASAPPSTTTTAPAPQDPAPPADRVEHNLSGPSVAVAPSGPPAPPKQPVRPSPPPPAPDMEDEANKDLGGFLMMSGGILVVILGLGWAVMRYRRPY